MQFTVKGLGEGKWWMWTSGFDVWEGWLWRRRRGFAWEMNWRKVDAIWNLERGRADKEALLPFILLPFIDIMV